MLKKTLCLTVIILLYITLTAQQYSFRNFSVAQGLGSANVNHIFQDKKGFIWFATQGGGISKFDGKVFTTYTKNDGLIDNDVTFIAEDVNGNIWAATASGASLFNHKSFKNFNNKQGFTNGVVYSIYVVGNDSIYFVTDNGLVFYNRNSFQTITYRNNNAVSETFCITEDNNHVLWIGTSNGIYYLKNNVLEKFELNAAIQNASFFSCINDSKGNLFFGSTAGNFIKIDSQKNVTEISLPEICRNDFIGGIAYDNNNNYWLATDHGLLKYSNNSFKLYSEKEGLSVDMTQTVMCDYEGNIWIGSLGGGVDLLSSEAFVNYNEKNGLLSKKVTAIAYNRLNNDYYIATNNGLYVLNNKDKNIIPIKSAQNLNIVSIAIDQKNNLWLATLEGIYTLTKTQKTFTLKNALSENEQRKIISPTKIICDSKGNIWVTAFGSGLYKIKENKIENINSYYDNLSMKLLTVFEDSKNNLWLGTYDNGIAKIKGNSIEYFEKSESVWCIAEGNKGNIYFGTGESGLMLYNGKGTKNFSTNSQLLSNGITAIGYDSIKNTLWVGSEASLQYFTFSENNQIETIESFNEFNGFTPKGVNQNSIYINAAENNVWLGTINGLWNFNYNLNSKKNTPPRLSLNDIRLFYQKTDWSNYSNSSSAINGLPNNLTLPYNKNHLTFDIQALTTHNVRYVFKLHGQDIDWSSPTANQEITFSNIEPGKNYTFLAKAINAEGVYSNDIIQYSFYIKPAWWNTWWFRLTMGISFIAMLITFIKVREKTLKDQNIKLEKVVAERTKEIAQQKEVVEQTLSEKETLLQEKEILLKEIHHRVKNNLQTISSILMLQSSALKDNEAKKAIAESQGRVQSIALVHQKLYQNDGLEKIELSAFVHDLVKQIKSLFSRQKKPIDININIEATHLLIDIAIPLGLILNELLTNSYKYAFEHVENGSITISFSNTENINGKKKYALTYNDNGPGFAFSNEKPATLGLRLIYVLSKQIGAEIEYSNIEGSKYKIIFSQNAYIL